MNPTVEDLEDPCRYRQIQATSYSNLLDFVLEYLRRRTGLTIIFWSVCIIFTAVALTVRIDISGHFPVRSIWYHTLLGLIIFPLLCIPLHEAMHVIPFVFTGARRIRFGVDLRQYMFYVTAHRFVTTSRQFTIVAIMPFALFTVLFLMLVFIVPGLWKWSLSLLLFVHTTMCAGDFALMNFLWINRRKKIYTWDDADKKVAYFYEEI